jgi:hypothetical protein
MSTVAQLVHADADRIRGMLDGLAAHMVGIPIAGSSLRLCRTSLRNMLDAYDDHHRPKVAPVAPDLAWLGSSTAGPTDDDEAEDAADDADPDRTPLAEKPVTVEHGEAGA